MRRYGYVYDKLNRLLAGFYQKDTNPSAKEYFEKMDYDLNGNITNLKRSAASQQGAPGFLIDNLTYGYFNNGNSNRLISVTDGSTVYDGYPDTSGIAIPYDANGNMISHEDKGILQIDYNFLNLPNYLLFNKNLYTHTGIVRENTNYLYRADGTKLKKTYNHIPALSGGEELSSKITEYLDGFQYETLIKKNNTPTLALQFVPTAEGYYDFVKNKYIYQYKDQIGNIRVSYYKNDSNAIVVDKENNYYPFGLEHTDYNMLTGNTSYNYGFQEQEKQLETGWSSFKWRNYDPTIGRFFNIDPLSEKYSYQSHYNFSENRVVDGRELEGLEVILVKDTQHNKAIIKTANNGQYADNANTKTIHVFAHGNPSALYNENGKKGETTIDSGAILNKTLNQNSELWKNSESKEGFTVVLHSCRTGRCTVDKQGNVIDPVALEISKSKEMKGVTIIAPDERDGFSNGGNEIGPQVTKNTDHNGDYLPGTPKNEKGKQTSEYGSWNSFQNGQRIDQQPGNTKPNGKDQRSWWDRIFN